jgi:hypothetical protein
MNAQECFRDLADLLHQQPDLNGSTPPSITVRNCGKWLSRSHTATKPQSSVQYRHNCRTRATGLPCDQPPKPGHDHLLGMRRKCDSLVGTAECQGCMLLVPYDADLNNITCLRCGGHATSEP